MHIIDLEKMFSDSNYSYVPEISLTYNAVTCLHDILDGQGITNEEDTVDICYASGEFRVIIDRTANYEAFMERLEAAMAHLRHKYRMSIH